MLTHKIDEISRWAESITFNQKVMKEKNIDSVLLIAPNKHSIYGEFLPEGLASGSNHLTDLLVVSAQAKGASIVDLKSALTAESKGRKKIYYKGDSHWNPIGAAIAYQVSIEAINRIFDKQFKWVEQPSFKAFSVVGEGRAGTARLLKIENLLSNGYDTNYKMEFDGVNDVVCSRFISLAGVAEEEKCTRQKNDQELSYTNKVQQIENSSALNQAKVLWLRDSFGAAHSPLLVKTFSTLWSAHYYWLSGEKLANFIEQYQPDLVIYQVIERGVFTKELQLKITGS
jgi:hypothetical protein